MEFVTRRSVLERPAAARFADKLLEHGSVHLPEGRRLSHLSQMIYAKPETKHFQVLENKQQQKNMIKD